jgi:hypothetical protein
MTGILKILTDISLLRVNIVIEKYDGAPVRHKIK